jgi:hypothetical protein
VDFLLNNHAVRIFPIPVDNELSVETADDGRVYTHYPHVARKNVYQDVLGRSKSIDTSHLSPGLYLLYIQRVNGSYDVVKFIKK